MINNEILFSLDLLIGAGVIVFHLLKFYTARRFFAFFSILFTAFLFFEAVSGHRFLFIKDLSEKSFFCSILFFLTVCLSCLFGESFFNKDKEQQFPSHFLILFFISAAVVVSISQEISKIFVLLYFIFFKKFFIVQMKLERLEQLLRSLLGLFSLYVLNGVCLNIDKANSIPLESINNVRFFFYLLTCYLLFLKVPNLDNEFNAEEKSKTYFLIWFLPAILFFFPFGAHNTQNVSIVLMTGVLGAIAIIEIILNGLFLTKTNSKQRLFFYSSIPLIIVGVISKKIETPIVLSSYFLFLFSLIFSDSEKKIQKTKKIELSKAFFVLGASYFFLFFPVMLISGVILSELQFNSVIVFGFLFFMLIYVGFVSIYLKNTVENISQRKQFVFFLVSIAAILFLTFVEFRTQVSVNSSFYLESFRLVKSHFANNLYNEIIGMVMLITPLVVVTTPEFKFIKKWPTPKFLEKNIFIHFNELFLERVFIYFYVFFERTMAFLSFKLNFNTISEGFIFRISFLLKNIKNILNHKNVLLKKNKYIMRCFVDGPIYGSSPIALLLSLLLVVLLVFYIKTV